MKAAFLQPQINTVGLVGHWKLWDGTAFDYSLNGSLGTLQENATYGFPGIELDGTNDYISIDAQSQIDITTAPLSIFAWIKLTDTYGGYIISKNLDAANNNQYGLVVNSVGFGNKFNAYLEGEIKAESAEDSILIQQLWYFIGFTWDGTNVKCFVNGSQSGSTGTYSGNLTTRANCAIGKRAPNNILFGGLIDNVMMFNTVKTTEEAKSIYETTRGRYGV